MKLFIATPGCLQAQRAPTPCFGFALRSTPRRIFQHGGQPRLRGFVRASDEQKSDSERATANGASDDGDAQGADQDTKKQDGPLYAEDDIDRVPKVTVSPAMAERMKKEYYSLGGSPNRKLGANWFLWISLAVAGLAILSALTGALPQY
ncbi:hypothetical protein ACKKBG_A20670 [Auxenochlorella protothecoides x Auxenochlorella symbiontica]